MLHRRACRRESFTVSEANATLPLVRAILTDVAALSSEVIERRQRLSLLLGGRDANAADPYHQELVQIEEELEKDKRRLREYVEELRAIGVELTNGPEGIVAFPAIYDEQRISLSWKLGEPEVMSWYPRGGSYIDRQPLTPEIVAELGCRGAAVR